jgi:MFS family permease
MWFTANSFGTQADRFGRRITYGVSSVLFLGTSVGCIFAPTIGVLLAFRALQGFAGGRSSHAQKHG